MTSKALVDEMIAQFLSGDEDIVPVLQDAIEAGVEGAGKTVYMVVTEKASTWKGVTRNESRVANAFAIITPGKSIRLIGRCSIYDIETKNYKLTSLDKTFNVGDSCLRYSYNGLDYIGTVEKTSAKTVTIKDEPHKTERQDIAKFWRYNVNFDLIRSEARNSAWMD